MIDFTIAEILTGLDLSAADEFSEAVKLPKLILTGDPLQTDASFRARLSDLGLNDPTYQIATGRELDAIGALHGLIRDGYRAEASENPAQRPPGKGTATHPS